MKFNRVIEIDETIGQYHLMVQFDKTSGFRSGYVGLPKDLFDEKIRNNPDFVDKINVHNSLSYRSRNVQKNLFYLGFDCNSFRDRPDTDTMEQYGVDLDFLDTDFSASGEVRTKEFVYDELISVIKQIKQSSEFLEYCLQESKLGLYERWQFGMDLSDISDQDRLILKLYNLN